MARIPIVDDQAPVRLTLRSMLERCDPALLSSHVSGGASVGAQEGV